MIDERLREEKIKDDIARDLLEWAKRQDLKDSDEVENVGKAPNILELANKIVKQRGLRYGEPSINFSRIEKIYNSINPSKPLTAKDLVLVMIATKLSREIQTHHRDNLIDVCGYIYVLDKINKEE